MKRLFDKSQKRHLYIAADGKCEQCSAPLEDEWDAHHVVRYADDGITEVTNALALCKACHRKIHRGKDNVKTKRLAGRCNQQIS